MNKALFKMEFKSNAKFLVIFMLILSMYTTMIISMFDPDLGSALTEFAKTMPEIFAMFGMANDITSLISFISNYLYGMLLIVFPMVFSCIVANRLIVKKVENGSMAYLLSAGNTRRSVFVTQWLVLVSLVSVLILYCVGLGLCVSMIMFPNELDVNAYLQLNAGLWVLHFTIASITFISSCLFNEGKNATLIGAGIPVLFILMQMLSNMGGYLENMKYANLLTLFDAQALINGESQAFIDIAILFVIGIGIYFIANRIFEKKNMSL